MISELNGLKPNIHPTVFVARQAIVVGDVNIDEDSSVWFNSVVRGDVNYIRIGKRTNIQDNSVLHVTTDTHPLLIGDDVTAGHGVILHGCTINSNTLIGMGSIVLDGAVIESNSIVGAGSVVPPGFRVPSGSLVMGVPAKIKRELSEKEIKDIKKSAMNYVQNARNYLNKF
ncbi:MAG: gamma carbonic anhydrase family protein [Thermodesulfobacteriota bacterium]